MLNPVLCSSGCKQNRTAVSAALHAEENPTQRFPPNTRDALLPMIPAMKDFTPHFLFNAMHNPSAPESE